VCLHLPIGSNAVIFPSQPTVVHRAFFCACYTTRKQPNRSACFAKQLKKSLRRCKVTGAT